MAPVADDANDGTADGGKYARDRATAQRGTDKHTGGGP